MTIGGAKVALVSEVLDRLLDEYGGESARRSVLFQAALQVCADESRRVKQGQPAAPLEVLVQRARAVLESPQDQAAPTRAPTRTPPSAPAELPSLFEDEPPAATPEAAEPPGAPPDLFVDESIYEELGQRHRRIPMPIVLGVLVLLGVAAGTYFIYTRYESPSREPASPRIAESYPPPGNVAPEQAPTAEPTPVRSSPTPVRVAPTPVAQQALPEPIEPRPARAPEKAARPAAHGRWEGAERMASSDWTGRAPIFVIHFSSYREREKAQRDAARIGQRYGRPVYVARVDLATGAWYRVVLGDFATAEQARAFHAELVARNTPDLGGVYRLTGP